MYHSTKKHIRLGEQLYVTCQFANAYELEVGEVGWSSSVRASATMPSSLLSSSCYENELAW